MLTPTGITESNFDSECQRYLDGELNRHLDSFMDNEEESELEEIDEISPLIESYIDAIKGFEPASRIFESIKIGHEVFSIKKDIGILNFVKKDRTAFVQVDKHGDVCSYCAVGDTNISALAECFELLYQHPTA
jgi:hypothetical protein